MARRGGDGWATTWRGRWAKVAPALPACMGAPSEGARRPERPPSAPRGRLVLLTDHRCFSSCLLAADLFRRLGAVQVGETTDRMTRFGEVREELLPSGLRTFSTLQKVNAGRSGYGPYAPDRPYPGDVADTAAVLAWIARS